MDVILALANLLMFFVGGLALGVLVLTMFHILLPRKNDCPREYKGYTCRGTRCDHSRDAWIKATQGEDDD